jgi:hypothetical protein
VVVGVLVALAEQAEARAAERGQELGLGARCPLGEVEDPAGERVVAADRRDPGLAAAGRR